MNASLARHSIRYDIVSAALWAAVALRRHREATSYCLRLLACAREMAPRGLVRICELAMAFVSESEALLEEGGGEGAMAARATAEYALASLTACYGEECPLTELARASVARLRRAAGGGGDA